jgi:hypothetical protein
VRSFFAGESWGATEDGLLVKPTEVKDTNASVRIRINLGTEFSFRGTLRAALKRVAIDIACIVVDVNETEVQRTA